MVQVNQVASRIFQALRMAVNDELPVLERGLITATSLLKVKGRMSVLSFHSLETKAIASFKKGNQLAIQPVKLNANGKRKKFLTPSDRELKENSRSRSVQLRAFEKQLHVY